MKSRLARWNPRIAWTQSASQMKLNPYLSPDEVGFHHSHIYCVLGNILRCLLYPHPEHSRVCVQSFRIILCGSARSNQHYTQGSTLCRKWFIWFFVNVVGSVQQLKPITCFTCFFQGNFQLRNKILLALCILCFVDISTDTCTTSANLISNNGFSIFF